MGLRTYPLGFGLRYLAAFEHLKKGRNLMKKNYQAGLLYKPHKLQPKPYDMHCDLNPMLLCKLTAAILPRGATNERAT